MHRLKLQLSNLLFSIMIMDRTSGLQIRWSLREYASEYLQRLGQRTGRLRTLSPSNAMRKCGLVHGARHGVAATLTSIKGGEER